MFTILYELLGYGANYCIPELILKVEVLQEILNRKTENPDFDLKVKQQF